MEISILSLTIIRDFFEFLKKIYEYFFLANISQNIQRGDPWDFFIIGDFFKILKIFPKYQKTLGIFFRGYPPQIKKKLMHFWMN